MLPLGVLQSTAPAAPRNVLTIVYDDLRPELSMYNASWMSTPHLQKLADEGTTFERAYCQQSVCSPSRMSFTTGRSPATTKAWNFLAHFRQATCTHSNRVVLEGAPLDGTRHPNGVSFDAKDEGDVGMTGGAGQCCTDCTASSGCVAWTMVGTTCTLLSSVTGEKPQGACPNEREAPSGAPCMSGPRGTFEQWTPLPQHLKEQGLLTLGVGKWYHDVNKGLGVLGDARYPGGTGLPPLADPVSWSNVSVQNRNFSALQARFGKFNQILEGCAYTGGAGFGYTNAMDGCTEKHEELCSVEAPADGSGASPPFCDAIAFNDAIDKLRYAAAAQRADAARATKGAARKGFFLAVGIRRPHLTWRVPSPYSAKYAAHDVTLPLHETLDASIDPIAWVEFSALGGTNPRDRTNTNEEVRTYRAGYYAAVSWGDYVAGRVLDELDALDLTASTAVIVHSDHGWHLGERNMWEKRTLWENTLRVPLIMRVPWKPMAKGARVRALVELVDIYRTVCDLLGVPLPTGETHPVEGASLAPLLDDPSGASWTKTAALSTYPRCPRSVPLNSTNGWQDNSCIHATEAADFGYMGYSMRVDHTDGAEYRFTMWAHWNGTSLTPRWDAVHSVELYNHSAPAEAGATIFDNEHVNIAASAPKGLVAALAARLQREFSPPSL